MSLESKASTIIGIVTIILSVVGSLVAGLWLISWDLSKVHKQVEINHQKIEKIDSKVMEIAKIIVKDRK